MSTLDRIFRGISVEQVVWNLPQLWKQRPLPGWQVQVFYVDVETVDDVPQRFSIEPIAAPFIHSTNPLEIWEMMPKANLAGIRWMYVPPINPRVEFSWHLMWPGIDLYGTTPDGQRSLEDEEVRKRMVVDAVFYELAEKASSKMWNILHEEESTEELMSEYARGAGVIHSITDGMTPEAVEQWADDVHQEHDPLGFGHNADEMKRSIMAKIEGRMKGDK